MYGKVVANNCHMLPPAVLISQGKEQQKMSNDPTIGQGLVAIAQAIDELASAIHSFRNGPFGLDTWKLHKDAARIAAEGGTELERRGPSTEDAGADDEQPS